MIEHEVKKIVAKSTLQKYKKILDGLTASKKSLQVNYYFDTPNFMLYTFGRTLRVRQKESELVLQYKYDKHYTGKERICREYERKLECFPESIFSDQLPDGEAQFPAVFNYVGCLVTERIDYLFDDAKVSLDMNFYLGEFDCEVELEFQEYGRADTLLDLLCFGSDEMPVIGKYDRFVGAVNGGGTNGG